MKYISVKEASKKWGYCEDTIRRWCRQGRIKVTFEAEKKTKRWLIPADAPCPKKEKSSKYH